MLIWTPLLLLALTDEPEAAYRIEWPTTVKTTVVSPKETKKEAKKEAPKAVSEKEPCTDCGGKVLPRPAPSPQLLPKFDVPAEAVKRPTRTDHLRRVSADDQDTGAVGVPAGQSDSVSQSKMVAADDQRRRFPSIWPFRRSNNQEREPQAEEDSNNQRRPWWKRAFRRGRDQEPQRQQNQQQSAPSQSQPPQQQPQPQLQPQPRPAVRQPLVLPHERILPPQLPESTKSAKPMELPTSQPAMVPIPTDAPIVTKPTPRQDPEPKLHINPDALPVLPDLPKMKPVPIIKPAPTTKPKSNSSGLIDIPVDGPGGSASTRRLKHDSNVTQTSVQSETASSQKPRKSLMRDASVWVFSSKSMKAESESSVSDETQPVVGENKAAEKSGRNSKTAVGTVRKSPVGGGLWLLRMKSGAEYLLSCDAGMESRLKDGDRIEIEGDYIGATGSPLGIASFRVSKVTFLANE